jgi:hypothetical protein
MSAGVTLPVDEALIDGLFDRNLLELEAEGTRALSPYIRDLAKLQVRMYWRRLQNIARQVTDTEVRLQLPAQKSPAGRTFSIEGIVDIVREGDGRTTMYDLKTHDHQLVRENKSQYAEQLNVYAHIWQKLRGERLDATAVICTTLPPSVELAARNRDDVALAVAFKGWDPVIPIDFDAAGVENTVSNFGGVVDRIEDHDFTPPTLEQLREQLPGSKARFAVYVCRNCDARYSCRSYQRYAAAGQSRADTMVRIYTDFGEDDLLDDIAIASLEIDPPIDETD